RTWIDKNYQFETAAGAYNKQRYPNLDPYQDIFNEIANDLSAYQSQLPGSQAEDVRRVAALRYADDLSPEAFAGYVDKKKDGDYELVRLPASNDPIFVRTEQVRQREDVFMDTLNQHYTKFANDASDPYRGWRQSSREEAITIHELQKSARWRTGLGIASILASVAYGGSGNGTFQDRLVQDALMYMGTDVLKTAAVRRQEKRMHTESLQELSSSFNDEVQPLVVDIKGTQHRLTGTVEAQYQEWRDLLHQVFVSETGFVPSDLQVYQVPAPDAAAPAPDAAAKAPDGKAGDQSASAVNGGAAAKSSGDSSSAASGNGSAAPGAAKGGSAVASPAAHASSVSTGSAAKGTAPGASTAAGSAAPAADAQTGSGSAPSKADAGAKANAGATADAEAGGAG
ncbi:MAG TPA: hypothetical protein VFY39_07125, partial [Gammaproteobacteria bacterium]|nr:hypothetical protein [Gammaproteobacteria bacterium]